MIFSFRMAEIHKIRGRRGRFEIWIVVMQLHPPVDRWYFIVDARCVAWWMAVSRARRGRIAALSRRLWKFLSRWKYATTQLGRRDGISGVRNAEFRWNGGGSVKLIRSRLFQPGLSPVERVCVCNVSTLQLSRLIRRNWTKELGVSTPPC